MKTYEAKYNPEVNKGVYGISLVESPAMEGLFVALSKDEPLQLKEVDAEKRILMGLVLEPNKPIYRKQNGEEFYIIFSEETIRDLSYGFFKNNNQSNSTIEHDAKKVIKGVTFTESWTVENTEIDKSANFGFSYPKGSWMAVMKVDSDEVWDNYVKTGKVQGFSIDAMVSLEEVNLKSKIEMSNTNTMLEKILLALSPKNGAKVKLGSVMIADGSFKIDFEGEVLEEGVACWIMGDDETKVPVPVGEFPLEDGTILVVEVEGIVKEVKQAEEEEAAPAAEPEMDVEIVEALKKILSLCKNQQTEILKLKVQVLALGKQPAAKPIVSTPVRVDFSKMTKQERLLNTINKNRN